MKKLEKLRKLHERGMGIVDEMKVGDEVVVLLVSKKGFYSVHVYSLYKKEWGVDIAALDEEAPKTFHILFKIFKNYYKKLVLSHYF